MPKTKNSYGTFKIMDERAFVGDSGSAARFFPAFPITPADACFYYTSKAGGAERAYGNNHPTVKPVDLMRWLVRLVTRKGGLVLDPFCGSGSTGVACGAEGMRFVGIERERAYAEIAQRRLMVAAIEVGPGGIEGEDAAGRR
jgi:site-specific DNA-methyltransferase (adenine-specific)